MIPADLVFGFPLAAYALCIVPLLGILFWSLFAFRRSFLGRWESPEVSAAVVVERSKVVYWTKAAAMIGAWIFGVFALMDPKGHLHYPEERLVPAEKKEGEGKSGAILKRRAHEVIFLIDASASMAIPDGWGGETRLANAKDIADLIAGGLEGETASLYAFTAVPIQLSPSTTDYLFLRLMLRQIEVNEGGESGTNLMNALKEIRSKDLTAPSPKLRTLIILSDGGDTTWEALRGLEREKWMKDFTDLIPNPETFHLRLFTVGMGSLKGEVVPNVLYNGSPVIAKLEESPLRALSRKGRGEYFRAGSIPPTAIARDILELMRRDSPFLEESNVLRPYSKKDEELAVYDLYYQAPLFIALLFLAYALFWPDAKMGRFFLVFLLSISSRMYAQSEESKMNQAKNYAEAGLFHEAGKLYEEVLENHLTPWQSQVVRYNFGTVLLQAGYPERALSMFFGIELEVDPFPVLKRNVLTNIVIGLLSEQRERGRGLRDWEALNLIEEAFQADCRVWIEEGVQNCPRSEDLILLQAIAKEKWRKWKSEELKEVLLLKLGLENLLKRIEFMSRVDGKELRMRYGSMFAREAKAWNPLWESYGFKIGNAFKAFKQGQEFLESGEAGQAHGFWLNALQLLGQGNNDMFDPKEFIQLAPAVALGLLNEHQQKIMEINRLKILFPAQISEIKKAVLEGQKRVVEAAGLFLPLVLGWQKERFDGEAEPRCQANPWEATLPLFERGKLAAEKALTADSEEVEFFQEEALRAWQLAWNSLQESKKVANSSCRGLMNEERVHRQNEKEENRMEKQKPSMEKILTDLIQMDREDQVPKTTPARQSQGEKPW